VTRPEAVTVSEIHLSGLKKSERKHQQPCLAPKVSIFFVRTKELFGIPEQTAIDTLRTAYSAVGDRTQVSRLCSILALPLRQASNLIGWPCHLLGVRVDLLGCNRPILYYTVKHSHHLFVFIHLVVTRPEAVTVSEIHLSGLKKSERKHQQPCLAPKVSIFFV
jgi:hypothetical protein